MIDLGKIYFIQEYENHKLTQEFRGDCSLDEIIANFEQFLKGAGYHFEGHLDIVDEEIEYNSSFNSPEFEPTVTFSTLDTPPIMPDWSHPLSKDGLTREDVAKKEGKYPGEDSGIEDMK